MFNRPAKESWSMNDALSKIRSNITKGTPINIDSLKFLANLYKGIWEKANLSHCLPMACITTACASTEPTYTPIAWW
jgi:hypothetical protein